MYIKNIKTGLLQECHNDDVIRVCKKDPENYKVTVAKPDTNEEPKEEKKEEGTPLEEMSIKELKEMAKEKNIEGATSLNKNELLAVLKDVV